ncbi:MAG: site-specific DNA-methyltransferase, partial [Sphingobacteriia bacterium]|nr:site-specific DNA-methyltransferase [Sphingobacteriia bacterium]
DIVLDPFMGSGTTGLMALRNDRKFVGIELSVEYYNMSKMRIQCAKRGKLW